MTAQGITAVLQKHQAENIKVAKELASLPLEALNQSDGKGWTALQCFEHLAITNRLYLDLFDSMRPNIGRGKPDATFKLNTIGKLLVWMVGPKGWMYVPVPDVLEPSKGFKDGTIIERYLTDQEILSRWIGEAKDLDLQYKFNSPINEKLKLRFGEALMMLTAHDERHLSQAKRAAKKTAKI